MKYIITWEIDDYPECGGGDQYDILETFEEIQPYIDDLKKEHKESIKFNKVYICVGTHEIDEVKTIIKYKISDQTKVV